MDDAHRTRPLVAAGVMLIAVSYGLARYAYGLYLPSLRVEFGFGASTAGLLAAVGYSAYCAALVAGGALAGGGRARGAAIAAGACAAIGTGAIAIAGSAAVVGLGIGFGGLAAGLASPALTGLIAGRVESAARDRAMTVVNAGTGVGVLVCAPAALAAPADWRAAFALFAALGAVVAWAVAVATAAPRARRVVKPGRAAASTAARLRLRDRAPLALGALGVGAASSAYWTFGRDLLTAAGAGGDGPLLWMVVGASSMLAAATGDLMARRSAAALWTGLLAAQAAGTAALALAPAARPVALASAVAFGASFVGLTGVIVVWATRTDARNPAAAVSGAFVLASLGSVAGSLGAGGLIDAAGYEPAFLAAAAVALACVPLAYTPAARRALACAASSNASSSGSSGVGRRSAVAISQSANHAFFGRRGPCR
jgi:predicted MFS family arabinose efflux permease